MLLVKDPLLLNIKKHEKHLMYFMNFAIHRGTAFIWLSGLAYSRLAFLLLLSVCTHSFDALKTKKNYLRNVSVTKTLQSNNVVEFSCTIKE